MIYPGLHTLQRRNFVINSRNPPIDITNVADKIKYTVCNYMEQDIKDVESPCRKRDLTIVRQTCMYFLSTKTNLTLKKIGRMFGGRDHSTVIYANQTINDLKDTDKKFAAQISELDKLLELELNGVKGD